MGGKICLSLTLVCADTVLLIGGKIDGDFTDSVTATHIPSAGYKCTKTFPPTPEKMSLNQAVWLDGKITVCSGQGSVWTANCYAFNPESWKWETRASMMPMMLYSAIQKDENKALFIGGKD